TVAYSTVDQLSHSKIGVLTGTNFDELCRATFPDAQFEYFNTLADILTALHSGRIDTFAVDDPVARTMMIEDPDITYINDYIESFDFAAIFRKVDGGNSLLKQFDEFMKRCEEDGIIYELQHIWFETSDPETTYIDYKELPDINGTVRVAVDQYPPFTYSYKDGYTGYEVQLVLLFARENGYGVSFSVFNTDSALAAIQTGKMDIAISGYSITDERKEVVEFSLPTYSGGVCMVVEKASGASGGSFIQETKESFVKTFITEERYKLFLNGMLTTLVISVCSVAAGTFLGYEAYMLCRHDGKPEKVMKKLCYTMDRMPIIVLLMIFYYVLFASVRISGSIVSIIAFSIVFGCTVYSMLRSWTDTVKKGQFEAGYALGFSDKDVYKKIIIPQIVPLMASEFRDAVTGLLKATAVVGYVAVVDLTKAGDIVRARTFDAFFPLISVAVIYFILAAIVIRIAKTVRVNTKRRRKILL
ncbi:MAG: transporter substrate-binding domain-containing protein, partial [Firmicutes bacterium]|nr:transporter substrate-binding domain-containing protein [Bacillota bacterium]